VCFNFLYKFVCNFPNSKKWERYPFRRSRVVPYGQTDMTKLIVALWKFANVLKNGWGYEFKSGERSFRINATRAHSRALKSGWQILSLCISLTVHLGVILVNNQLDALFFSVLISLLYMFRATQCSSSGESIVSIHHLVYITLYRWLSGMPILTCIPDNQLPEWYITDVVLIQLILLMMSTGLIEICREVKSIHWKKVRQFGY
jgi:hypothetical protein